MRSNPSIARRVAQPRASTPEDTRALSPASILPGGCPRAYAQPMVAATREEEIDYLRDELERAGYDENSNQRWDEATLGRVAS